MKKPSQVKPTAQSSGGIFNFVGDIKSELKKVTWTSKEELQLYTKIVVMATFLCGMGIYFVDLFIQGLLATINAIALGFSG